MSCIDYSNAITASLEVLLFAGIMAWTVVKS